MRFKDKVVLVTGASRGIGRSTAIKFGGEGAKVVVNYRSKRKQAEEVVHIINESGGEAYSVKADVSKHSEVEKMIQKTVEKFGRIDIAVNNAGYHDPKPFFKLSYKDWDKMLHTNVTGTFMVSQASARVMMEHGGGHIINVASVRGLFYCGRMGNSNYSASKSAIMSLTTNMAMELAPDIRVNAVAPGPTNTDLSKAWDAHTFNHAIQDSYLKRLTEPDEVANAIAFLASNEASGITGEILVVDGGYSLK